MGVDIRQRTAARPTAGLRLSSGNRRSGGPQRLPADVEDQCGCSVLGIWLGRSANYWFWNEQTNKKILEYRLAADAPQAARAYALDSIPIYDAAVACWDAKYTYWAIRPFQLDPTLTTVFPSPNRPSYPAAHGCLSSAAAATLGYLFP
ncbi:MAG TPA: hypothetical protein VGL99_15990 [Chloroflexota bacterium]|jgi:hypothetical protein